MAALSQDAIRRRRGEPSTESYAITTSGTLYVGSLLARTTGAVGRASAATAATGRRILGVAVRKDSTVNGPGAGTGVGNTAGSEKVTLEYGAEWLFTVATAIRTNTSLGLNVFIGNDNQVAGTAVGTAGKRIVVGELVAWEASDKSTGWVAVRRFATTNIAV